ncbi:hypothetical protein LLH00_08185 [bacterium]|nr:hypothetical protein [bacterium]
MDFTGNNNGAAATAQFSELDRIRAIRALADTGDLRALEKLLPFSGYATRVSLTAARNAVLSLLSCQSIGECPLEIQSRENLDRLAGLLDMTCQMWKGKNLMSTTLLARALQKLFDDGHAVKMDLGYTREGMFLAAPALDRNGAVVVEGGTPLSNSLLRKIHMAGVTWIEVRKTQLSEKEKTQSNAGNNGGTAPDRVATELSRRFAGYEHNPVMMKIRDAALQSLQINVVGIQRTVAKC